MTTEVSEIYNQTHDPNNYNGFSSLDVTEQDYSQSKNMSDIKMTK